VVRAARRAHRPRQGAAGRRLMGDDTKKPRFSWYEPLSNRGRTIVISVAVLVVVGAIVAAVVLGIPFF